MRGVVYSASSVLSKATTLSLASHPLNSRACSGQLGGNVTRRVQGPQIWAPEVCRYNGMGDRCFSGQSDLRGRAEPATFSQNHLFSLPPLGQITA